MSFFSLFLVKIWLEIMFNNVLDRKKNIFALKNSIFQCPKNWFFLKGLTHAFGQKCNFFLYLFSVKIRPEIMFNNVLYRKETFFSHKKIWFLKVLENWIFPKGLTHAFGKKVNFLLYLFSVKISLEVMVNNVAIQNSSF